MKQPKQRRHHPIRRIVLLLLLVYLAAALLPYALVPMLTRRAGTAPAPELTACAGERATILPTGDEALAVRMNLIANAQRELVVGTYILANDDSGHTIASALLAAADRGVRVRIVIDGLIGEINLISTDLGRVLNAHENIELRSYNRVNLLQPWTLNACFHEKYVIADGQVMVLGGRNLSNEFLTHADHPAYNYDMDIVVWAEEGTVNGPAAAVTSYFDSLWDTCAAQPYPEEPGRRQDSMDALRQALQARYDAYCAANPAQLLPVDWAAQTVPIDGYALLTNPTRAGASTPAVWDGLAGLMSAAQERLWIMTPYLVLSRQMKDDLTALSSSPAEVKLLTNSRAGGNNIIASADMLLRMKGLLGMGMDLYSFQGPASMHTKALLIDHDLSVFGSFNFDMRSAYIDTEMMLAVRSEPLNALLEAHMNDMFAQSLPLDGSVPAGSTVTPLEIDTKKNLIITLLSPFVSLVHYLL